MNKYLLLIAAVFLIGSCNSNEKEPTVVSESLSKKDSTAINPEDEFEEINLDSVLKDVKAEFSTREKIDSTFIIGAEIYEVKFEHYCLFDSAIRLDRHYTELYKLDSFVAHNFISNLLIIKNGDTLIKTQVTKELFRDEADSTLMKFGALRFPTFHFSENKFSFGYSFTIPLTDVGVGVVCKIDLNGRTKFDHN